MNVKADVGPSHRLIKAKDFSRRLSEAIERHPLSVKGHGRQRWLGRAYEERFGSAPSPEGIRKWFSGESRPRPDIMRNLALILDVDEAWLSLGITPNETPTQARKRSAKADGAVNYVAGLIQMHGGSIIFDRPEEEGVDFHAIIQGTVYPVQVKLGRLSGEDTVTLSISSSATDGLVFGVVLQESTLTPTILKLPPPLIEAEGKSRGGYIELSVTKNGRSFKSGNTAVPILSSFTLLA